MKKVLFPILALVLVLALVSLGAGRGEEKAKLSDLYLSTDFSYVWGPGSIVSVLDLQKKGVGFALNGITGSGTSIGDGFPLSANAPGKPHSVYGSANPRSDWTDFKKLKMKFKNLGTNGVWVNVYMNTGFTGAGYNDPTRDTYWQGNWTYVPPGKTKKVKLKFDEAEVYNAADELVLTAHPDGTKGVAIYRLDEVTNIGFQVADFSGGPTSTWLVVRGDD